MLQNIKRNNADDLKDLLICSAHLEAGCFKRDLKAQLIGMKPRVELKDDAVPTLFTFNNNDEKQKLSEA